MLGNKFALSATLLLAAVVVNGSAMAAPLKILGFEDDSCATWVQSKNEQEQRREFISWVRGFLSGHNYGQPSQQVSSISSGTIEQYANRYCASNPNGQFADAVFRLSDEFSGRNQPLKK